MSAAQWRLLGAALLATAVSVWADSIPLDAAVLPTAPEYAHPTLIFKATLVSLDSLASPLASPRGSDLQLSVFMVFQPFPVRLMGNKSARHQTSVSTLLLFFQRLVLPNKSPCQVDCSARCEHTYGCPILQDRSAKND